MLFRSPEPDDLAGAALEHLGHVTIIIAPLDGPAWRYQRSTHTLYVDPRTDIAVTCRDALIALLPGRPRLRCLPGGHGEATEHAAIPAPRSPGACHLRAVRGAES